MLMTIARPTRPERCPIHPCQTKHEEAEGYLDA